MKRFLLVIVALLVANALSHAAVKPNSLFTDGAVLQHGIPVNVWGTANDGEKITVTFAGQKVSTVANGGQWKVTLKPLKVCAEPRTLTITGENTVEVKNILVGEVWVCSGQSNMQWTLSQSAEAGAAVPSANDALLRLFYVPRVTADTPQADVRTNWSACTPQTVPGFSAVAYFFGRDLRKALNVPVGLIHTSWGGTPAESWTAKEALEANPALKQLITDWDKKIAAYDPAKAAERNKAAAARHKEAVAKAKAAGKPAPRAPRAESDPAKDAHRPTVLYNAMIAPLLPYGIKGAIWYQGESNSGRAKEYQTLFPAMIKCWRDNWREGEFPFFFVQIAPHNNMVPEIREAQFFTWQKTPNTGMAVITDYGNASDIHPKQKEPVGARLALVARAVAYSEKIEYSGPTYKSVKFDGNKATLTFSHVGGGLVAKDGALKGFTIAGADKKFVAATAEINGDTIIVNSAEVAAPVAVRYGWANVPDVNLYNKAGLPATPFRTDPE
jgi:sialate O-acetylesterase